MPRLRPKFQSARPRGARQLRGGSPGQSAGFNPRARVGRDEHQVDDSLRRRRFQSARPRGARLHPSLDAGSLADVSIRAPAWGATPTPAASGTAGLSFNPRARVGRDRIDYCAADPSLWFQSARPRGARRDNPHLSTNYEAVSIRAPAWGATALISYPSSSKGFQSARPRGARRSVAVWGAVSTAVSIRAPAWGATSFTGGLSCLALSFNPRARVGRDATHEPVPLPHIVSIRAPAWGATETWHFKTFLADVSIRAPAWGATCACVRR